MCPSLLESHTHVPHVQTPLPLQCALQPLVSAGQSEGSGSSWQRPVWAQPQTHIWRIRTLTDSLKPTGLTDITTSRSPPSTGHRLIPTVTLKKTCGWDKHGDNPDLILIRLGLVIFVMFFLKKSLLFTKAAFIWYKYSKIMIPLYIRWL